MPVMKTITRIKSKEKKRDKSKLIPKSVGGLPVTHRVWAQDKTCSP